MAGKSLHRAKDVIKQLRSEKQSPSFIKAPFFHRELEEGRPRCLAGSPQASADLWPPQPAKRLGSLETMSVWLHHAWSSHLISSAVPATSFLSHLTHRKGVRTHLFFRLPRSQTLAVPPLSGHGEAGGGDTLPPLGGEWTAGRGSRPRQLGSGC